jgi:hypothetical protein
MPIVKTTTEQVDAAALNSVAEQSKSEERGRELPLGKTSIERKSSLGPVLLLLLFPAFVAMQAFKGARNFEKNGAVLGIVIVVVIIAVRFFYTVKPAHRRLMQIGAPFAYEELSQDKRLPVVLLRSFEQEQSKAIGSAFSSPRVEEVLVETTRRFGPAIAIGAPEDELPQLGAARAYVPGDNKWTEVALEWIQSSRMIVMLAGRTPGLLWELNRIIEHDQLRKTIVVCPNNDAYSRQLWRNRPEMDGPYLFARSLARSAGGNEAIAQSDLDDVITMFVGQNGRLVFIKAALFDVPNYQKAILLAIAALLGTGTRHRSSPPASTYAN